MLQKIKLLTMEEYNQFGGNYGKFETSTQDTSETTFDNIQASVIDRIDSFFKGALTKLTEVIVDGEPTWIDNLAERLLPNDLNRLKKAIYYELEDISVFDKYTLGSEGGTASGTGVNYTPAQKAIISIRDELSHTAITELKKTEMWRSLKLNMREVTGVSTPGTWRIDAQFNDAVRLSALAYGITIIDNADGTTTTIPTEYKGSAIALMDSINENWDNIQKILEVSDPEEIKRQLDEIRAELDAIQAQDVERKLLNKKDFNTSTTLNSTTPHTMIFEDEEKDYIKSVGSKIFMNPRFVEDQVQNTIECSASNATEIQKWIKFTYYETDGTERKVEFQDDGDISYEPSDTNTPAGVGEYNNIHSIPRISFVNAIIANGGNASYEFTTNDYYEIEFRTLSGEAQLIDVDQRLDINNISRVVEQIESFIAGKLFEGVSTSDNNVYISATLPANLATGEGIITVSIPPTTNGNGNLLFNTNVNINTYLPVRANVNYIQPIGQNDPNEYIRTQEVKDKVIRIKYDPINSHYVCINYSEPTFIHTLRISEPSSNMGLGRVFKQQELQFLFMNSAINSYQPDLGNSYSLVARIINGECIERLQDANGDNYWVVAGTFEVFSQLLGEEQILTGKIHIYDDNKIDGFFWGDEVGEYRKTIIIPIGEEIQLNSLPVGEYKCWGEVTSSIDLISVSLSSGGFAQYVSRLGSASSGNAPIIYISNLRDTSSSTNQTATSTLKVGYNNVWLETKMISISTNPTIEYNFWAQKDQTISSLSSNIFLKPTALQSDLLGALIKVNNKKTSSLNSYEKLKYDEMLVKQKEYEDKRKTPN